MRILSYCLLALLGALLIWAVGFGGFETVALWANAQQRETQNALAAALRAVRAGEPGGSALLMGLCFVYGFVHAVGPGHGKILIGGYGAVTHVTAWRLSGLALAASLAQAAMAVALVLLLNSVLSLGREHVTNAAETYLAPASYAAIGLVGLWLALRGVRRIWRLRKAHPTEEQSVHSQPSHDAVCAQCGHHHGPSLDEAAQISTWREALAIVLAIAMRPCTGALFLLILCFALGIGWMGVLGAFVMGLGTASLSILVAIASVMTRNAAQSSWSAIWPGHVAAQAMGVIELIIGGLVVLAASGLLTGAL